MKNRWIIYNRKILCLLLRKKTANFTGLIYVCKIVATECQKCQHFDQGHKMFSAVNMLMQKSGGAADECRPAQRSLVVLIVLGVLAHLAL